MILTGRTALITGGGTGLGAAIANSLHGAGASVVVAGRRAEPVRELAGKLGERARWRTVDVADPHSVAELEKSLQGTAISIVINNAGVGGPVAKLIDIEPAAWDEVFDINVRGVFLICRAFLPAMIAAGGGDVINLASVSGKRPLIRRTPYCASKMAVIGLTSTLAFEVGPHGVNVNSLSPGPVAGERMDRNFTMEAEQSGVSYEAAQEAFVSRSALGRMVEEKEVGQAVLAMLQMPGLSGADVDLSAGMVA